MKLSLYLPISMASSHSATELNDGKAEKALLERGMDVPWDLPTERVVKREWGTAGPRRDGEVWKPGACGAGALRGLQALHQLAQGVVDLRELGPLAALLLPAAEHQLVEGWLAVGRGGQAEPILHSLHHLQDRGAGVRCCHANRRQTLGQTPGANPWGKPPSSQPLLQQWLHHHPAGSCRTLTSWWDMSQ